MTKTDINKIIIYIIIALLSIGSALGVWAIIKNTHVQESDSKLIIYTSMYPLYEFTKKIGGNKVEVHSIVPPGVEPHHYEGPSGKLLSNIEDSDLVIVVGAGMESYISNFKNNTNIKSKLVITANGVTLLEKDGSHEHNHHDNEYQDDDNHEEKHNHTNDPHIWLSIENAIIQSENIKNALVDIDPENAIYYQRNFDSFAVILNGLQAQYDELLSQDLTHKTFVVSHSAFGYVAEKYGLTQISLTSIMSTGDISGKSIQNAIQQINSHDLKVVFYTSTEDQTIINSIKEETGVVSDYLSTVETLSANEQEQSLGYVELMARNLVALYDALK